MKICIDPGHGGKDPGAVAGAVREKDLTLSISLYMAQRAKQIGFEVTLTRDSDIALNPTPRTDIVKRSGAKICISNHINSGGGSGAEVIYSLHSSGMLANAVLQNIKETGMPVRRAFFKESKSQPGKDYYFMHRLTYPTVPETIIIEYGFIDNAADRKKLIDADFRKLLVEAVLKALCYHTGVSYVLPTKEASNVFTAEIIDRNGTAHSVPVDAVKLENGTTWIKARTFTDLAGGVVLYDATKNKSIFDFSK